jgi:hypothetical protein
MRKTIIFCDGGLGNRLNSLLGGLFVADKTNSTPVICWPENNWCGCGFEDLYITDIEIIKDDINKIFEDNINNIFLIHENQTKFHLNKQYNHSLESLNKIVNEDKNIVYYHSTLPSYIDINFVLDKLKSLNIQTKIINKTKKFIEKNNINKDTHGILFRKTDYSSNPDISLNDNEIYNHIKSDLDLKYYICSDDKNTEDIFNELENVFVYPKTSYVEKFKEGGWNDFIIDNEGRSNNFNVNRPKQSVIEAFIGLLVLSQTNIIVNVPSTFLDFAKYYSYINFLEQTN